MYRIIIIALIIIASTHGISAQINWFERPIATDYDGAFGLFAVDMDGDDDIDLVTTAYDGNEVTWWENDGNQQFLEHNIDDSLYTAYRPQAGDLDGDGDMDVIVVAYRGHQVAWYENDGQMNFTKYLLVTNYNFPRSVSMYDVDGDTDMDIVTCTFNGDISWWENIGYPNFTRHVIDTLSSCSYMDVSDLDNDGDADILGTQMYNGKIVWYENDGNQVFQRENIIQNYSGSAWAKPYDFNGDGAWDILACAKFYSAGDNDISWFENDGYMNFTRHVIDADIDTPRCVEAADFDLDGDLDIVAGTQYAGGIYWWENDQNTNFIRHNLSQDMDFSPSVLAIDLDQDGDKDIVGCACNTDNCKWWQNLTIYTPGIVEGEVIDEYGSPVESVYVDPSGIDVFDYTDSYGRYELVLPQAMFDISFQKPGYFDHIFTDVQATAGDTTTLDVTMYLEMPGIRGRIVNEHTVPVESVLVSAPDTPISVYSDDDGEFTIEGLPQGAHDILFQHPFYLDTTLTDMVEPGPWDTLNVVLKGNGVITGFVGDPDSIPVADVYVRTLWTIFHPFINPFDFTDSTGHYFFHIVPEINYSIALKRFNYVNQILRNVMVAVGETLTLDPVYLDFCDSDVMVWYGNLDLSPVMAPIGDTILIDVYAKIDIHYPLEAYVGFFHLPLATDDRYIADHLSVTQGVLYYPLTDWDDVRFFPPDEALAGWRQQSLVGFCDLGGDPNPPFHSAEPVRIASFALEVADDPSLIGDTVFCFMEGYNILWDGGAMLGDIDGATPYYPCQLSSPLYFVDAPPPQGISVWYGNPDNSYIYAPIGDTIQVDVYVQSTEYLNIDSLHLALAADDQYIIDFQSDAAGALYYPLTNWDDVQFLPPYESSPGWHSQSLYGVADTGGDPNPYLLCPVPTRIASFALEIVNDSSLIGDVAACLAPGNHPVYGGSFLDDNTGSGPYYPQEYFLPLYIADASSGDCQYVVGDANGSGSYNGLDITYGVSFFKGGNDPMCPLASCPVPPCNVFFYCGDVNGSCSYNGLDITYGVAYFKGGSGPIPCPDCPPAE